MTNNNGAPENETISPTELLHAKIDGISVQDIATVIQTNLHDAPHITHVDIYMISKSVKLLIEGLK